MHGKMPPAWSLLQFVCVASLLRIFAAASAAACPQGCLCVGTTVRCMFLNFDHVPRVPENTTVLDLRFNNIQRIPANAFQELPHLDALLLDSNQLQMIENQAFEKLRNLRHLFLSKNRIRRIEDDAFSGLHQLEQLSLQENELEEIAEAPFRILLSLERLHLNDNHIRTVQKGALQNLRQLRRLRLDGNPLLCDCGLVWFTQMLREKQTITQASGQCSQPDSLRGRPLTSLDSGDFACERPRIVQEPQPQEVELGESANLTCKAEGEPRPDIYWTQNGVDVYFGGRSGIDILEDGTLVIRSAKEDHEGAYRCRAENAAGAVTSKSAQLSVVANFENYVDRQDYEKPRILGKPSDVAVMAGRSVTLRCPATGKPTPLVTWKRDGVPLLQHARYHVSLTAGMLLISATDPSDAGTYRCTATSPIGEDSAAIRLDVQQIPYFLEKPREQDVLEGENVEFICSGAGSPAPELSWYKDGQRVTPDGESVKVLHGGKVLRLQGVARQAQGVYTCHAENAVGYSEAHADLSVNSKTSPHFVSAPANTEADPGSSVEVLCMAEGHPTPTLSWRKDGEPLPLGGRFSAGPDGLRVVNVQPRDEGRYECVAENEMGRASAPFYILVRDYIEGYTGTHPGDRYVLSALHEAEQSVDRAVNSTLEDLLNNKRSTVGGRHRHAHLLRIFRYPDSEAQRSARAAEVFERALNIIQEQVAAGMRFNISDTSVDNLLSPGYLDLLAEMSGCLQHRQVPDCSDTCFHNRFRTYDGTCNNLRHPMWGASLTPFERLLPAEYENGFNTPVGWTAEKPVNGHRLPLARAVSTGLVSTEVVEGDSEHSHMLMQWGQFLDHDMDFSMPAISHERFIDTVDCADSCDNVMPCFPIEVPADDRRVRGHRCIEFVRSSTACGSGRTSVFYGALAPREQTNQLTAFIDASNVYGSRAKQAIHLRNLTSDRGLLRVGPRMPSGKYLLPFNDGQPNDCKRNSEINDVDCFLSGDVRANEQLGLLAMHTLWFREHNRLAEALSEINPHWDGERLYQEARKIVGAQMQHVTYEHWLPKILGPAGMAAMGPYRGYKPNLNPSVVNVFATAAMRFGHFLINPVLLRLGPDWRPVREGPVPLRRAFFAPHLMLREGGIDPLMRGLLVAPAKLRKADQLLNSELTDHLFEPALVVAQDLASFNIQRGRDHGMPGYNKWRQFCNLSRAESFEDLRREIPSAELRRKLERLYKTPDNIDVWVGAIGEEPLPGSKVGPTLTCLLSLQFARLRDADRLWYLNEGTFTAEQREELKRSSLARVLCENGDNITHVTRDVFTLPEQQPGGIVHCTEIPALNLEHWRERTPDLKCPEVRSKLKPKKTRTSAKDRPGSRQQSARA
ncbi:peroxidasin homolog isoform X3 [Rhipicephalus sanguineus]|uniref:peroxidasin homolog isoform X3 n=1 Tax=Rhipicephalus sanguineus TaxID=34632 RepID=UPI00189448F3|nr:peroxidasin homolog isoform X3 [Rhipicephalus sanguineus]